MDPSIITSDFESGLISAVRDEFPNARHQGCYFHFTQAIWRKVQKLGLSTLYIEDEDIRMPVRQLMAFGFAPLLLNRTVFGQLKDASAPALLPLFQ